ncbi:aspartyl protease family protein [Chitinophagaceae bacterium LB-8]|uniref:Aspartyl protease family protein n=1 Tax=Paraflavisolibacter caeni TaxID=2982496 RepID=A0A9X2XXN9_9BACT|nr:aspartyl protease family protein [Paraflavisolibacter caeni]MCU7550666.1 aspartyl protease family protein [Paraflavisolibacter caeni]
MVYSLSGMLYEPQKTMNDPSSPMKKLVIYIICLAACLQSFSQEEFIEPSKRLARIPFRQLTGGVILLNARFAAFPDSLNFILDTGSGGISLDSTTVEYFGLKPEASTRTIRGIAGIRQVSFLNNQKLHFPSLTIDSLNFHVNNYEILTAVYGERIDGIIGYSVFSRYIVKVNYDSSFVEFWTKGLLKYPRGGYLMRPFISTLPVNFVRVKDEGESNTRFLFDLGAGLNLMLTTDFIKDSAILNKKRKLYTKEAEGLGGKIDMHMTVIKEARLGPYKFKNVPVYIFDDDFNITSYPYLGGILGSDIIRRFNLILNYDKRDFYLIPNSHFNDAFDYIYSGIELYFQDGKIIVGDVAKGSPAEAAGLLEGDIVVAVNKDFSQNLQHYKASLQASVGKAKLIVMRGEVLKEIEFKVKSILSNK